jgi:hypothetical protein
MGWCHRYRASWKFAHGEGNRVISTEYQVLSTGADGVSLHCTLNGNRAVCGQYFWQNSVVPRSASRWSFLPQSRKELQRPQRDSKNTDFAPFATLRSLRVKVNRHRRAMGGPLLAARKNGRTHRATDDCDGLQEGVGCSEVGLFSEHCCFTRWANKLRPVSFAADSRVAPRK